MGAAPTPGMSAEAAEGGDYIISPRDVFQFVRKRLWIIALVAVVLTGASVGLSLVQTPTYEASIMILVGQERGITENPAEVGGLQQLTKTMARGVESRPVAEAVIQQLNLEMTAEGFLDEEYLSVEQIPDTQYIQVAYRDPSPERAQQVANAIGDVFSNRMSEVGSSASAITATVWERAVTPEEPVSPNPGLNGLLALMLGLMLGTGLAVLLEYLDASWRSPEEVEKVSGVPTFGIIPNFKASTGKKKGGY